MAAMAAAAAPETYIGSVISLTSKSEIRYEGVLYTINTEESSIGLRNVRSFGTEGRKDGLQIPASDKIYEYILFRGGDIKDLQVKSSPPAHPSSLYNDPAIIQSHYPHPTSVSASLPSAASTTAVDRTSGIQLLLPFQGNLPATSENIQSRIQVPPPFQGNLLPTSQNVQSGIQAAQPFQGNLPATSQNVQLGLEMSPPFQGNLPPTSQNVQSGIQIPPPFQGILPPYQPPPSLPSWNSSPMPSSVNGNSLAMPPMYWPGYYTPPSGFPHLQQQSFIRSPHSLIVPQALQQPVPHPGLNASIPARFPRMPDLPSFLQPSNNQTQTSGMSTLLSVPAPSNASATESSVRQLPNKLSSAADSVFSVGITPPPVISSTSTIESSIFVSQGIPSLFNNKPLILPDSSITSLGIDEPANIPDSIPAYQPSSQPTSANAAPRAVTVAESIAVVTPGSGQLLLTSSSTTLSSQTLQTTSAMVPPSKPPSVVSSPQTVPSSNMASSVVSQSCVASSSVPSSQQLEASNENKKVKQPELKAKQHVSPSENKQSLLPAPKPVLQKPAGAFSYTQYNNRGRGQWKGRGRGHVQSRPITIFKEDFDFMAMNEKFNKDEVWDHLGKSKGQFSDGPNEYEDDILEDAMSPGKPRVQPVYVKDDFFDSLSSNAIDNGQRNGRIKSSEQRKIDTETFGDSARHRPTGMRGRGRGPRGGAGGGGPRGRGGYYGRGYAYPGRGCGYSYPNHQSS